MKLSRLITAALLPLLALAAKPASKSGSKATVYDRFRASQAPIKLDDVSFEKVTKGPRDYTVAVLMTAIDSRFGCSICQDFAPEWEILAKSWTSGDKNDRTRVLFGTLDFDRGQRIFQSVGAFVFSVVL